ncbi:MAG TPA: ATP synthase F0 subunit B [Terriglobia bacterium]|nr:ATP synthase F0 subunit B [Terriglobia bacterium]
MKKLFPAVLIFLFLSVESPLLRAQEAGEHSKKEESAEESPMKVAWKWVNLLILLGGMGYLLKKPALEFFEGRKKEITSGLERARSAQEESSQRMTDIERRLGRLSEEIASLRTQADAESAKEREKILADARRDVDRLVDQSRQEVERIARGIERDIKAKIADAVVDRASHALETQMTEDDQKRVVVRFLNKV